MEDNSVEVKRAAEENVTNDNPVLKAECFAMVDGLLALQDLRPFPGIVKPA